MDPGRIVLTRKSDLAHSPAALRVIQGVHTGTMWVNCYGYIDPLTGFGGTKMSGYGTKGSAAHMDTYLYPKNVYIEL